MGTDQPGGAEAGRRSNPRLEKIRKPKSRLRRKKDRPSSATNCVRTVSTSTEVIAEITRGEKILGRWLEVDLGKNNHCCRGLEREDGNAANRGMKTGRATRATRGPVKNQEGALSPAQKAVITMRKRVRSQNNTQARLATQVLRQQTATIGRRSVAIAGSLTSASTTSRRSIRGRFGGQDSWSMLGLETGTASNNTRF